MTVISINTKKRAIKPCYTYISCILFKREQITYNEIKLLNYMQEYYSNFSSIIINYNAIHSK